MILRYNYLYCYDEPIEEIRPDSTSVLVRVRVPDAAWCGATCLRWGVTGRAACMCPSKEGSRSVTTVALRTAGRLATRAARRATIPSLIFFAVSRAATPSPSSRLLDTYARGRGRSGAARCGSRDNRWLSAASGA